MDRRLRALLALSPALALPVVAYALPGFGSHPIMVHERVGISWTALAAGVLAAALLRPNLRWAGWAFAVLGISFLASWPGGNGLYVRAGLPIVLGAWAGSRALSRDETALEAAGLSFSTVFFGLLIGGDVLRFTASGTQPWMQGSVVVGGGGVLDGLVLAPVAAAAWTVAWTHLAGGSGEERDASDVPGDRLVRRLLGHDSQGQTRAWLSAGWVLAFWLGGTLWLLA